jgi:hypothetical protein
MKMTLTLVAVTAALIARASVALASPPPCVLPHACIEKPGYVMAGFTLADEYGSQAAERVTGGSVAISEGIKAVPAFIISDDGVVAKVWMRGKTYAVLPLAVFVTCPSGRVWMGNVQPDAPIAPCR